MRVILMVLPGVNQMLVTDMCTLQEKSCHANGVRKTDWELYQ
jgi:hypothetical protein